MSNIADIIKNMDRVFIDDLEQTKDKMSIRNEFAKSELGKICDKLDECYDKLTILRLDIDKRFFKIFKLIEELSENSNNLEQVLEGKV